MISEKDGIEREESEVINLHQFQLEEVILNQLADILYHSYLRKYGSEECKIISLNERQTDLKQAA